MPASLEAMARAGRAEANKRQRVDSLAALCAAAAAQPPNACEDCRFTDGEEEDDEDMMDNDEADDMEDEDDEDEEDEDNEEEEEDDDDEEDDCEEGEEDEADDDEGEEGDSVDDLPCDVNELRTMVTKLRAALVSARNKLNASSSRTDHYRPKRRKPCERPQTEAQKAAAQQKHEERAARFFKRELKKRGLCRAAIVNRLGLALTVDEREQARGLGFLQQEWFLAFRSCVAKLQKQLYTPENSLEMRLTENISVRAFRRMRRILTEIRTATGEWTRLVLFDAPKHASAGGTDRSLTRKMNLALAIFPNRPILAPFPLAADNSMHAASKRLLQGRQCSVAIPSKDGYSGAAWDLADVTTDVFNGVAQHLKPLRTAAGGLSCLRRLWIGFDGLSWTKRNGLVRWCVRSLDVKGKVNDTQYARDGVTYAGHDKNSGLVAATEIGGNASIRQRTDDGVVVTKKK